MAFAALGQVQDRASGTLVSRLLAWAFFFAEEIWQMPMVGQWDTNLAKLNLANFHQRYCAFTAVCFLAVI